MPPTSAAPKIPVSVVVMTKNEAGNVQTCLEALTAFDQIFVVDSGSEDETVAIAGEAGATVVPFSWNGRYPKKKQWCLENLPFAHRHVLYVDADERMTGTLEREIRDAVADGSTAGWFVGLDYVWMGRVLRHGAPMFKLALLDRDRACFVEWNDLDASRMWEVEGHYQPEVDGRTATLHGRLLHDDHDSLYDWFSRHNRYSDWEAVIRTNGAARAGRETQVGWRGAAKRLFVRLPGRPWIVLVHALVLKSGWRDGRPGIQFALAKAMYQWQVDLKVAELRRKRSSTPSAS